MKTARIKLISVLVPYVAVLIGLWVLKNAWVAILLYHLGITMFLIAGDRKSLLKGVCTGWNSTVAVLSVVMSVAIFPIIFFFWKYMQSESIPLNCTLENFGLHGTSWLLFMIYFSTVQPIVEEIYWRGYLECGHKCFSWADFAFAGYHIFVLAWFMKVPWLVTAFVVLLIAAYVWRGIVSKLEGLMVPLLSHVVADISIIAVIYVLIQ